MKMMRVCLIALGCVSGALAFGVVANTALNLLDLSEGRSAFGLASAVLESPAGPAVAAPLPAPTFTLASASTVDVSPVDVSPVKVRTVAIAYRNVESAAPAPAPVVAHARVPLPRPRPATAPAHETTVAIARQPGPLAIAAATKSNTDETDPLSPASIEKMKTVLALTAEQEEYWPAVAAELRAIGRQQGKPKKGQAAKIDVDRDTAQRLYWAAAPLLTRLSYDQKRAVKQIARSMGLEEVAEAL